ncbi:MAG TPA: nitroreductase family protein [Acidimicrobiales bacterium]|nr:nitroreductase family protein [Acidimicrobiales bacterium]
MAEPLSLYDGLVTTRAIRRYLPDDIPPDDLNAIMFAATRGPSGHNSQPFRFVVLRRTPEAAAARALLAKGFALSWQGERQDPPADDTSRRARMARTMNAFVDSIEDAPVIVIACNRDRHGRTDITAGASVYPACQNLLLAARALGYGGVMTQWHHPVRDELARVLELPDGVLIAGVIPLGKPAGGHGPVRRRPLPELVYENTYEAPALWAVDPEGTRYTGG